MKLNLCLVASASADIAEHLVTSLPGFPDSKDWGFKVYSGLLEVPGPVVGYDKLNIHYQFHTSKRNPSKDPVAAWHQGGPGASSITIGLYGEMGALIVGEDGNYINPKAWNNVANMLYLESPAGSENILSDKPDGYSECIKNGQPVDCYFDDRTQAEAYAHTLTVFFQQFPEFASNDFYLTGESYFGQFGPNIAHYILNNEPYASKINMKGMALGNACWGGDETTVDCNGPNSQQNDVELFHGKGLFSKKLYNEIYKSCDFPDANGQQCQEALSKMRQEVGPYNVYNIYDNCPNTQVFLEKSGKDMTWLLGELRGGMHAPMETRERLLNVSGGYQYDCLGDVSGWINREDVKKALHLDGHTAGRSRLSYSRSGPASITLYPELVQKLRLLIYNGDADACVPYIGNEEWITGLEAKQILKEESSWAPWFSAGNPNSPSGYITKYSVPNSDKDFAFATVRLAGHMVPQYQPDAALTMISKFFDGETKSIVV